MFTGTHARGLLKRKHATTQSDRELLRLTLSGSIPNSARLWQLNRELFEHGGPMAELPTGWEQRVERRSGRVFYINHNDRTTCWADPRQAAADQQAEDDAEPNTEEELGEGAAGAGSDADDGGDSDADEVEGAQHLSVPGVDAGSAEASVAGAATTHERSSAARATIADAATTHDTSAAGATTSVVGQVEGEVDGGVDGGVDAEVDGGVDGAVDGAAPMPTSATASPPMTTPACATLPIVGSSHTRRPRRTELQLLSSGLLQPSSERLRHESGRPHQPSPPPRPSPRPGRLLASPLPHPAKRT